MRMVSALVALLMCLVLGACVPEHVVWTADGSRAVVLGDDGLHVSDADGKLGPMLIEKVSRAAWLPDGKRAVVFRSHTFMTWAEVIKEQPSATTDKAFVAKVRAALVAAKGDWGKFDEATKPLPADDRQKTLLYMRDTDKSLQGEIGDAWANLSEQTYEPGAFQIYELSADEAKPGQLLGYGKHGHFPELRVSPTGALLAVTFVPTGEGSTATTMVMPVAFKPTDDAWLTTSSAFVDWTPDGKSLVFIRPMEGEAKVRPATLCRQTLLDAEGKWIHTAKDLPGYEELVGMLYDGYGRVRVAGDGRVFFSAANIVLPAALSDVDTQPSVFMFNPGKQATLTRVVPRSAERAVGDKSQYFSLSPDGQRMAIPFDDGRVSVLSIGTGEVLMAQPESLTGDEKFPSVPTWRNATELTFVRLEKGGRQVVRYDVAGNDHKSVVMSETWSDAVRGKWLAGPPAAEKTPTLP